MSSSKVRLTCMESHCTCVIFVFRLWTKWVHRIQSLQLNCQKTEQKTDSQIFFHVSLMNWLWHPRNFCRVGLHKTLLPQPKRSLLLLWLRQCLVSERLYFISASLDELCDTVTQLEMCLACDSVIKVRSAGSVPDKNSGLAVEC